MLPSAFEDYLEAILTIKGDGKRPVALQEIADALDTERTVVEDTLTSLIEEGYLEQAPGGAVRLTERGFTLASRVARKHFSARTREEQLMQCLINIINVKNEGINLWSSDGLVCLER